MRLQFAGHGADGSPGSAIGRRGEPAPGRPSPAHLACRVRNSYAVIVCPGAIAGQTVVERITQGVNPAVWSAALPAPCRPGGVRDHGCRRLRTPDCGPPAGPAGREPAENRSGECPPATDERTRKRQGPKASGDGSRPVRRLHVKRRVVMPRNRLVPKHPGRERSQPQNPRRGCVTHVDPRERESSPRAARTRARSLWRGSRRANADEFSATPIIVRERPGVSP